MEHGQDGALPSVWVEEDVPPAPKGAESGVKTVDLGHKWGVKRVCFRGRNGGCIHAWLGMYIGKSGLGTREQGLGTGEPKGETLLAFWGSGAGGRRAVSGRATIEAGPRSWSLRRLRYHRHGCASVPGMSCPVVSPVPESQGPGAPSFWSVKVTGTGAW